MTDLTDPNIVTECGLITSSNLWELEEASAALVKGDLALARRYVDKALEHVRCMYCHEGPKGREVRVHYKGWIHVDCGEKYKGRLDYLHQHGEQVPDSIRERTAEQEPYDSGEDIREFEDDGWGNCLNCRRAKSQHVGCGPGPCYCPR